MVNQYIPHGHCYLWQKSLLSLHILSDTLIAISYYLISAFLIFFIFKRKNIPFKKVFILFSAFILSCGTTHIVEIWTLWQPNYWVSGFIKAITSFISFYTALDLIPLMPQVLNLPSGDKLELLNQQLQEQITEKANAEAKILLLNQELEKRVAERTSELTKANQYLQESKKFNERITALIPNMVYIYDLEKSKNVYSNSYIYELLGFTTQELQDFGSDILNQLIHPSDLNFVIEHFQKCFLLQDEDYLEINYRIRDNQGKWHWFHDKNTIFSKNSEGKPQQILGITQDITENREIQLKTERLNQELAEKVIALEKRNQERIRLGKMNEFLQACLTVEEAKKTLADLLLPLFPNTHGAIYLLNNNDNFLEAIAAWGIINSSSIFEKKDCWALRRSNLHLCKPTKSSLYCFHVETESNLTPTLCLPMMAKGETLGLFYLRLSKSEEFTQSLQELAETVAQNIAMALSNLKLQETLQFQSLRDPLTGLFNRRYLLESLSREIDRAKRKQQFMGIIIIDIDHFKRFNDNYGHEIGDLVLKEVGAYLLDNTRQYDIACRYGGEELIIVMPDASLENTICRAEEIRQGIKKLNLKHEGKSIDQITVSIGVSCFPDDGIEANNLINVADKALYLAKKQGRDRVVRC